MSALLKISRDEFRERLEKQILQGQEIYDTEVKPIKDYGKIGVSDRRHREYNAEDKDDFLERFLLWSRYTKELIISSFVNGDNDNKYLDEFVNVGLFPSHTLDYIYELKKFLRKRLTTLKSLVERIELIETATDENISITTRNIESKRVFIVHGHDDKTRLEVERMLTDIGYEPIVLFQQNDKGQTIIEKLERETSDICFAIVIYSHCDDGKAKEDHTLQPRARQNVVFEHGWVIAALGRGRVVALVEKGVETPGDLNGVIYKAKDDAGAWKYSIAKEMISAGLSADLTKIK